MIRNYIQSKLAIDLDDYIHYMRKQVMECEGVDLTVERLIEALEEDTGLTLNGYSLAELTDK